jgi:peptidyl-prolyl cis-trans isomerase C
MRGEDFARLAKALTEDPSGRQDGGDLGYLIYDQMVPEFTEAAL